LPRRVVSGNSMVVQSERHTAPKRWKLLFSNRL